jgi:phage-related protein
MRNIVLTNDFLDYYNSLPEKVKKKYDYVMQIIKSQYVVSEKFVKHLENTEFYEARITVGTNTYRTILFTVDSQSFMESKNVLFLNSFLKKSSDQYKSEIESAESILKQFIKD